MMWLRVFSLFCNKTGRACTNILIIFTVIFDGNTKDTTTFVSTFFRDSLYNFTFVFTNLTWPLPHKLFSLRLKRMDEDMILLQTHSYWFRVDTLHWREQGVVADGLHWKAQGRFKAEQYHFKHATSQFFQGVILLKVISF